MNGIAQRHGSIPWRELRELGLTREDVLDFSATVNPFPLSDEVRKLFTADDIASYPDTECLDASQALATFHNIPADYVAVTAGLTETIFILPELNKRAVQFSPTYGDYAEAYLRHRRRIANVSFPISDHEFTKTVGRLKAETFRLLIVCNPNNPDGRYLPLHRIQQLCELFGHATICVDESYQEMGDTCDSVIPLAARFRNLLILKSLTKPFGIGGLRAGYAVSSGEVLNRIRKCLMPWGVSSLVQRIIPALICDISSFQIQWKLILDAKRKMTHQLLQQGFPIVSGQCPFFLMKVGNAELIRKKMLSQHHIAVRSCTSFGMPEWIRVMPGRTQDNRQLLDILTTAIG